ncbi:winged helix DNA-binding domain-containing protein [Singulisphaera sp. PoT]|uniref:winged helix DNA-binding domain-containing protein n=1 Tax=Singulisphaera sp. PoT TaxID=3411797 RepID=UPI003BF47E56
MALETLSQKRLNRALLARQMLLEREDLPPLQVIERLVGMQAQQPQPPYVGLWTRLEGFTRPALSQLLHDRQVVRATTLRGTLHLMTAGDYLAFRGALQPGLSAGMRAILKERGEALDIPGLVAEARRHFDASPSTFTNLRAALVASFPDLDERAMGYAVRTHLPLVSVPDESAWGYRADTNFAVAEGWLGQAPSISERPHDLVLRYLAAFGPATAADVQTWSGLAGMKAVLEELRPQLQTFRDERNRELFDLPDAPLPPEDTPAPVRFLPGFDNVILSHADRTRIIADEHRPRVTSKNLLVAPTILIDGVVAGVWKCTLAKKVATLKVTPFIPPSAAVKKQLTKEGEKLARFIEPEARSHAVEFEAI